jgi:tetratricopeptide (TPR) repeat protein
MRWLICEYLLKGVFLGLLVYAALNCADFAAAGIVAATVLSGLLIGLIVAAVLRWREGIRPGGNLAAYLLFLLLESPTAVYAGSIFGLAFGAIAVRPPDADSRLLFATIGGGALLGLGLAAIRMIPHASRRWLAALAGAAALVAFTVFAFDYWELVPEKRQMLGVFMLLGVPFFYLLTFVGAAEESEVEVAAWCAALAVGVWLIKLTPGVPLLALVLPAGIYWLYSRHVQPGLRVFKPTLRGMSFARLGQFAHALDSLRRAVRLDPDNRLARAALWDVHRDLDADDFAADPRLLELIDPRMCLDRAAVLLLAETVTPAMRTEATHLLDLVEQRSPDLAAHVDYWRAVAATHARDFDSAAKRLAHVLDPSAWPAGNAARQSILIAAWRLALTLHPELKQRVGTPQLALPGRRLEAIAAVERELADVPDDGGAWTLKRILYSELTLREYEAGPVAEFDHAYTQQLGLALIGDAARWRRGIEYLEIAVRGLPQNGPTILRQIAETYERMGVESEARNAYERGKQAGLALGPKSLPDDERHTYFAIVKRLAEDAVARKDLDAAVANYQLYTAYERAGVETYRTLADLHEQRGDPLAALRATEQALLYAGKDRDLLDRRDKYYFSVPPETLRTAPDSLRSAVDSRYCLTKARQILDHRDADLDSLEWAQHLLELAFVLEPESIPARVLLARARLRRGERAEAVSLLESVFEPKPEAFASSEDEDAWYLAARLLGDLYLRELERPDRAVACFTAYRKCAKSGADTLYKLGEAYEHLGEQARAARFYEQVTAYDNHPLAPDARDALRRVQV